MGDDQQANDDQQAADDQQANDGQAQAAQQQVDDATHDYTAPDPTWTDPLSDELKSHEHFGVLSKFKGGDKGQMVMVPGTLVKSHLEQQKILGAKGVLKPAEDAGEDAWNNYYNELGRPEKHTDYNLKRPEFLEENDAWKKAGSIWNEGRIDALAKIAHAHGLTNEQWEPLLHEAIKLEMADLGAVAQDLEEEYNANVDALNKKWGPMYEKNSQLAFKTAVTFGGEKLIQELEALGINGNPVIMEVFYNIGERIGEHMLLADGEAEITPKLLSREELFEMKKDPRYTDQNHPEHEAFHRRVTEGHQKLAALEKKTA